MLPRLVKQSAQFRHRYALDLRDQVGGLAPHEFDEQLGSGREQEFLSLLGKMKEKAVGPHHGEDALPGAIGGPSPMIDLADAIELEGYPAHIGW